MQPNNEERHRNLYADPLAVLFPLYDIVIFLLMFPSNSVLVCLRKNLGYRLLRPWIFWVLFFILITSAGFGQVLSIGMQGSTSQSNVPAYAVITFAILMAALAGIHRSRAWELVFREPDAVHSMSRGDSFLTPLFNNIPPLTLPVFSFMTWDFQPRQVFPIPEWQIQRYVEPLLLMVFGVFLSFGMHWSALGNWLFVSGAAVAMIESLVVEKAVNTLLDVRDGAIEANYMKSLDAKAAKKAQAAQSAPDNGKVGGLVTASPEMARLRAQRQSRQLNGAVTTDQLSGVGTTA